MNDTPRILYHRRVVFDWGCQVVIVFSRRDRFFHTGLQADDPNNLLPPSTTLSIPDISRFTITTTNVVPSESISLQLHESKN